MTTVPIVASRSRARCPVYLLSALLAFAIHCPADTNDASASSNVLEAIRVDSLSLTNMYSEFVQERMVSLLRDPVVSKGVICFQKPASVRWETYEPYQSILLATDKKVEQFEVIDGKWQKLNLGYKEAMKNVMGHMTAVWSGRLVEQNRDFTFLVTTGRVTTVSMLPKQEGMKKMITCIEIHFAADLSKADKVVLKEASGDSTTITFVSQARNVTLPAGTFDMVEPLALEKIRQAVPRKEP